ncbi:MAG: serine/threonine protein kinase [Planctomycetaceae bacterium]|nr:serine/threonine protein kinase [Planctomycetaceae bacterium]|tara:strand:+ start:518 stop:1777 length:1260 start_codon:yes stop_codon:yes gene_type:complete
MLHLFQRFVLILGLFSHTSFVTGNDWVVFRGPNGDGSSAFQNLPIEWGADNNVSWSTPIPGEGWSSPVVYKDTVYLTSAIPRVDGNEKTEFDLTVLAIDILNGKTAWKTNVFIQDSDAPSKHQKNSHASPTPIVHKGMLYVHFGHQGTACLSLEGKIIWKTVAIKYQPVHGNGGTPIIVNDSMVFSVDGAATTKVMALMLADGSVKWTFDRQSDAPRKFSFSTPALISVNGKQQVISPGSDVVHGLDAETGTMIWKVRYDGYSVIPKPVYKDGLLYVSTSYNTPWIYCIDPSGAGDITDTHVKWSHQKQVPHTPSIIIVDGKLFMVSDRGIGSCLDAKTGEVIWQERIGGNFSASPILANGLIYLQSEQGDATVIEASSVFKVVAKNTFGERSLASYGVSDGALFIRTSESLYCVRNKK